MKMNRSLPRWQMTRHFYILDDEIVQMWKFWHTSMAHKKSAGTTRNGRDSNPKYLGVKITEGGLAIAGSVLIRQRGTDVLAGKGVGQGKDHTLFALVPGMVKFGTKRQMRFDNKTLVKKVVHIV